MTDIDPAVTEEFTDAVGLSALKAAGGRSAAVPRSHGSAAAVAPSPAAPSGPSWPPPATPEPFKQMVRQLDFLTCELTAMTTGIPMERESDTYMDEVADSLWPIAHLYGAGAERPTKGVLWMYAIATLGGFAILKYARYKSVRDGQPVSGPKLAE